jgi:hypothetical protein
MPRLHAVSANRVESAAKSRTATPIEMKTPRGPLSIAATLRQSARLAATTSQAARTRTTACGERGAVQARRSAARGPVVERSVAVDSRARACQR